MIYEFNGYTPVVDESAFVHPQAAVTGNVIIGKNVYIGPGAAVRGDWGEIIIKDGSNVQENCTIHMFPGTTVTLHESAHIGHGAIIHGAVIGKNTMIGMNAVVMDNAEIGDNCIVGALSFIPAEMVIPSGKIVVGSPAKVVRNVSAQMIAWKTKGTELYQRLPQECQATLIPCEPLREVPASRPRQQEVYQTWNKIKVGTKIFHITQKQMWEEALRKGIYIAGSLKDEGFIHCSTADSFEETANIHFRGKNNLVALCIDTGKVEPAVRMELAPSRGKSFPHIYGPLNIDAVENIVDLLPDTKGKFTFPKQFRL